MPPTPFDDRTPADLLLEHFLEVASSIADLRARQADLSGEEMDQLARLEKSLDLAPEEGGDELVAYWNYRIARDLSIDLDLEHAPPRREWDKP